MLTRDRPHNHGEATGGKRLFVSIVLNLVITLVEVVGGLMSGSLALLSDAMPDYPEKLIKMVEKAVAVS